MKKTLFFFTFAFCLSTFAFAQQSAVQLPATGQTISYHIGDDGDTKWNTLNIGSGSFTDNPQYISIGIDGTVFANTEQGFLVALSANDGEELWDISGPHYRPPAIGSDGTLFSGSKAELMAINPDGSEQWRLGLGANISSSPVLADDGTIYIAVEQNLVAVNPATQQEVWRLATGDDIKNNPAVGSDGTVYVTSGSELLAVNPSTHEELWRFITNDLISSSPSIGANGIIYIGANSQLYAINPDGTEKWEFKAGSYIMAAPAIGTDGSLYLPANFIASGYSGYGSLIAIHPDGSQKWRFQTSYYNRSTPTVGKDGTIYLPSSGFEGLMAIDPYGKEKWRYPIYGNARWSAPMAPDGTIYVSASMGGLTAVETNSGGLADSPWPMDGHDAQHTGRNDVFLPACQWPVITKKPENKLIETGSTATLSASATGKQPLDYKWYEGVVGDKTKLVGRANSFTTPALTESKLYWVEVSNSCGTTFCKAVTVAVGSDGQMKWYFAANDAVATSPAIGDDGTIYFAAYRATLYAVNPDGTEKWQFLAQHIPANETLGSVDNWIFRSDPTVGPDGTIYFGAGALYDPIGEIDQVVAGYLCAINPNGTEKWRHYFDESSEYWPHTHASPALGLDGTIYITDTGGHLIAINSDGSRKWDFDAPLEYESSYSSPTIGRDGTIYFSTMWHDSPTSTYYQGLYAMNPDGTVKWYHESKDATGGYASPTISADGTLYLPGPHEHFLALNPDGTEKWSFFTGSLCSNAIIGVDGTVYFSSGTDRGHVYALNPATGAQVWKSEALLGEAKIYTTPAIGTDGIIYLTMGNYLYALNSTDGSEKWKSNRGGGSYSSPVISPDGTLYLGSGDPKTHIVYGFLWAITTSSLGPADSYWPVSGQNITHSQIDPNATIVCNKPTITSNPQNKTCLKGDSSKLAVSATGSALSFQWYQGSTEDMSTPVGTGSEFTTPALTQETNFWVQVSNACGSANSETATVAVTENSVTISGKVFDINSNPIAGVSIVFGNGGPTVSSDAAGIYTAKIASNYSGTSTATLEGYNFESQNYNYSNLSTDRTNQDFTGTLITSSEIKSDIDLILIYPNPTTQKFKVQSSKFRIEDATIEIYDLTGKRLLEKQITAGSETHKIDTGSLKNGVYFCRIIFEYSSSTHKIIIQK